MTNMRFKIDVSNHGRSYPFTLQLKRRGLLGWRWDTLETFKTRDDAHAFYTEIKDLPEYLE